MSKSKKNTIDPQNIINQYGADSVRFFILSDSPPERDVQWSEEGMLSSYKFVQKFWTLSENILEISNAEEKEISEEIEIFTNQMIVKINYALEKFRYNVIIATFHEIYSFFRKLSEKKINYKNLKISFEKILIIMSPVVPHLTNECLAKFNFERKFQWPIVDKKYLSEDKNLIVIQVNGKKRGSITVIENLSEKELIDQIKDKRLISKYLDNGELVKTIYIKDRLINFIIK
jgi:leucyl-tRNA synthetase